VDAVPLQGAVAKARADFNRELARLVEENEEEVDED